jgi:hypothetical protein
VMLRAASAVGSWAEVEASQARTRIGDRARIDPELPRRYESAWIQHARLGQCSGMTPDP